MELSNSELIKQALNATKKARDLKDDNLGYVGSALITENNNIFTGISLVCDCGIGCCAEHSAIVEMIKNGEIKIKKIAATACNGTVIPPCGRCRELMYQINKENLDTDVIISGDETKKLKELLPEVWQDKIK